jgi:hypothetical protein
MCGQPDGQATSFRTGAFEAAAFGADWRKTAISASSAATRAFSVACANPSS